jgi:CBS domain containing-hemolysin-like protein
VTGLDAGLSLAIGLLALVLHLVAVALTRALRTYSRSRLEEVCEASGRPERADEIAHEDEAAERACEALAVLSGLALAALLGVSVARSSPGSAGFAVVLIALALAGVGYVAAGIVGRVHAEVVLDRLWPIAALIRRLLTPLTIPARALEAAAYRRARGDRSPPRPATVEVELHTATDLPATNLEADLPESTRALVERAVELAHRDVGEIMTPRASIVGLPATATARQAASLFTVSGRSRVPVFGEHRDDIVGILYAKDLFPRLVEAPDAHDISLRKLARPPMFVPESKNAAEMLDDFRASRVQMAVVMDEYGGVSGLITLEDLLEELVGPIDDEHDVPTPDDPVRALGGSSYEVDAALPLDDLNERLDLHLPTDADFETVGGLAFDALGRLPEAGATFRRDGIEFTVLEVADHAIRRVRIDLHPAGAVSSGE